MGRTGQVGGLWKKRWAFPATKATIGSFLELLVEVGRNEPWSFRREDGNDPQESGQVLGQTCPA